MIFSALPSAGDWNCSPRPRFFDLVDVQDFDVVVFHPDLDVLGRISRDPFTFPAAKIFVIFDQSTVRRWRVLQRNR